MLIKRSVINAIGVYDTRFFGLMSALDYGLRATRAGFKHIVPLSAWLHHTGEIVTKQLIAQGKENPAHLIKAAWHPFRETCDPALPIDWMSTPHERVTRLAPDRRTTAHHYQP